MHALFSDATSTHGPHNRGWIFYDAECSFCTSLARCLEPTLLRRGFHCAGLQEPWVGLVLGLRGEELLSEFRVRSRAGEVLGGADALLFLAKHIWWAWPLYALGRIPSPRDLLRAVYRWFAVRRHCVAFSRPTTVLPFAGKGETPCH